MNEKANRISVFSKPGMQSGQAILLIALTMVGLLGALGLAIDGGGMLFLYRDLQNATDAAIVAATYARCTNGDVIAAGLAAAADNGFTNDQVDDWVTVENPPSTGLGAGDTDYVQVRILASKPSYFIHVVYPGPLEVTNGSVGHCRPPFNPTTVGAMFGISRVCPNNVVDWTGSDSYIKGGVFSNSEVHASGGSLTVEGDVEAHTTVTNGITYVNGGQEVEGVDFRDDPLAINFAINRFAPDGEIWDRAPLHTYITSSSPNFANGTWKPDGVVLEGLYYVEGSADITGNKVNFGPLGVTIVTTGDIKFSGVNYPLRYYIDGFLLYANMLKQNDCGSNAISISGSSIGSGPSPWYGVIYAPRAGINISSSNIDMVGALVGDTINISSSTLDLEYTPTVLPPIPPQVEFAE